jgi:hypothetical protein
MDEIITILGGNSLVGPQGPQGAAGPQGPQGAAGAAGMGTAGAVFPGAPATGAVHFRTDLGLLCYWDGARWLTVQEYEAFGHYSAGATAGATIYAAVDQSFSVHITRAAVSFYVATINTTSSHWEFTLLGIRAGEVTLLCVIPTGIAGVYTANTHLRTTQELNINANYSLLYANAAKIGTPGTLESAVSLYYRKIIP